MAKLAMRIMSLYTNTNNYLLKQLEAHSKGLNDQLEQFKSISTDFETVFFVESYATPLPGYGSMLVNIKYPWGTFHHTNIGP